MSVAVIIPARYESQRLPGKPLAHICGKPMINWIVETALKCKSANKIIVATEDEKILNHVKSTFPTVDVKITSKNHECGTDRITEVVKNDPSIKYIVNFQGDEPLMPPEYIDKVIEPLLKSEKIKMASLITPITDERELENPNIVKVALDSNGYALYFSRSNIPFDRDSNGKRLSSSNHFRHLGIYSYTRETLLEFSLLPPSNLEKIEKLEQLRALENGIKIKLELVPEAFQAVDTAEDIKIVEDYMKKMRIKSL